MRISIFKSRLKYLKIKDKFIVMSLDSHIISYQF